MKGARRQAVGSAIHGLREAEEWGVDVGVHASHAEVADESETSGLMVPHKSGGTAVPA
jgi:hypothetical protein